MELELTPQGWAYYNLHRHEADKHFKIKDEFLMEAETEPNLRTKKYLCDQAAVRDTKARKILDEIVAHALTLGTKVFSKEAIYEYASSVPCIKQCNRLRHNLNYSWWNVWLSN